VDLFDAFSRASQHRSQSAGNTSSNGQDEIDSSLGEDEKAHSGDLLDVSAEILALRECKDLREELVMVESIFDAQYTVCLGADTFDRHFALAGIFGYTRPENGLTSP